LKAVTIYYRVIATKIITRVEILKQNVACLLFLLRLSLINVFVDFRSILLQNANLHNVSH
jgi:hypothetical protein